MDWNKLTDLERDLEEMNTQSRELRENHPAIYWVGTLTSIVGVTVLLFLVYLLFVAIF